MSGGLPPQSEARLQAAFRFGGSEELLRVHQERLLPYFAGYRNVLDLGCGRGVMLDLFRSHGIPAHGVDTMPEAVAYCQSRGLSAEVAEAVAFLGSKTAAYDAILCSHVIEHLEYARAEQLVNRGFAAVQPGGTMVIVTPNSRDISIIGEVFWLDPTHVRPYPGDMILAMLEEAGFRDARVRIPRVGPASVRELPGWVVRKLALGRYFGGPELIAAARKP